MRPQQWGLVLASYPDGSGTSWAVGLGRSTSAAAAAATAASGGDAALMLPNLAELSLQFDLGEGLLLTPGMLLMARDGGATAAFMGVNCAWAF